MYGAETCRSGIKILNILFTSHMHVVGFNSLYRYLVCVYIDILVACPDDNPSSRLTL
jgi:hypothetical protein